MTSTVPNFSKILFTGVKRKRESKISISDDQSELRLRILPKEDIKDIKSMHSKTIDESEEEDNNVVSMFSSTTKVLKVKEKKKKKEAIKRHEEYFDEVRKLNRIYTWGEDIPDPFINFSDLNLSEALKNNLLEFQINEPTPIQMQAIPLMLQKRDILASAPTGSGKTLAFILPILKQQVEKPSKNLTTLILEPTRVLARQVYVQLVKYCQKLNIKYGFLEEGSFSSDIQILVTTPTRLLEAANKDKKIIKMLGNLNWIVVDESDKLFDDENGSAVFKQNLSKIFKWAEGNHTRHAFFSATFSSEVEEWCKENLINPAMLCIGEKNVSTTSVVQELVFTGTDIGKMTAIKNVIHEGFEPPAIIFVHDKDRAGQLYAELSRTFPNIPCSLISSEITDNQKDKILEQVRERTIFILICTELIGRGIDLPTINLVINFDIPTSVVNYIHRVGRTGRGGRKGKAVTYFTETDSEFVGPIATVIHQAGFKVPPYTLGRLKEKKKGPQRKAFTSRARWEKVKKLKKMKKEIIPVEQLQQKKRKLIVDDDTGGDMIGKNKSNRIIKKKNTKNAMKKVMKSNIKKVEKQEEADKKKLGVKKKGIVKKQKKVMKKLKKTSK